MSAAAEFFLIAFAIYLWESTLWLPLRGASLRAAWRSGRWAVVEPGRWLKSRELGLVPLLPVIPDSRLAPCQTPPLFSGSDGTIYLEVSDTGFFAADSSSGWDGLKQEFPHLIADGATARLSSRRSLDALRRAKRSGLSPSEGISSLWKSSLNPQAALREWRRWQLVSRPLRPLCLLLTVGFFAGLPVAYLYLGILPMLGWALFLWSLMILIGSRLWWMGSRVYPTAKTTFRSDAFLCWLVPFHAMRAIEIAAVQAMSKTHPAALLVATGDLDHPWLARLARETLHPRPGITHDATRCEFLRPLLENLLRPHGRSLSRYESKPSRSHDESATAWCPRCLSLFEAGPVSCCDCCGVPLKPLD